MTGLARRAPACSARTPRAVVGIPAAETRTPVRGQAFSCGVRVPACRQSPGRRASANRLGY